MNAPLPRIVLASESPRRQEILARILPVFDVVPSGVPEHEIPGVSPCELAVTLAEEKARAVWNGNQDAMVIGADTIVVLESVIMGKPENSLDAEQMLNRLSGNTHEVITGVAVVDGREDWRFHVTTRVTFQLLTSAEIQWYVDTGEPFDKAGAYGIQGHGARLIKEIQGDYLNVVGFPLSAFYRKLVEKGVDPSEIMNRS